uniref:Uncharacterized protein n=1 Tax=Xiphophorus maculatus TaxID=8083 RepID=A0A3B5PX92_XIPMA
MRSRTSKALCPVTLAARSGVIPYPSLSMRALHFSSIFMMSRLPDSAQSWRAVFPFTLFRFTSAPRSRRNLAISLDNIVCGEPLKASQNDTRSLQVSEDAASVRKNRKLLLA